MKVIKNIEKCNMKYDKLDMNVESLMLEIYNHIHQSCGIKIMTSFWFFWLRDFIVIWFGKQEEPVT